jgi:hypothetical protein
MCILSRAGARFRRRMHQEMTRIKKNDPVAMTQMGKRHEKEGEYGNLNILQMLQSWATWMRIVV